MNKVHTIPEGLVKQSVESAIKELERKKQEQLDFHNSEPEENFKEPKDTRLTGILTAYDSIIAKERDIYSKPLIIELAKPFTEAKPFVLVYDVKDPMTVTSGTGGFESKEAAQKWYINNWR